MFRMGDTVIFDPSNFNPNFWNSFSEKERIIYYGRYGYGTRLKLFTFICEHHPQNGHCILMDIKTGAMYPMCHINDFRLIEDDEA